MGQPFLNSLHHVFKIAGCWTALFPAVGELLISSSLAIQHIWGEQAQSNQRGDAAIFFFPQS